MPLTRSQLETLAAPVGWRILQRPTLRTAGYVALDDAQGLSGRNSGERIAALVAWAKDNSLGLKLQPQKLQGFNAPVHTYVPGTYRDLRFPGIFKVSANHPEYTDETFGGWTCYCGRTASSHESPSCDHCGQDSCVTCGSSFIKLFKVQGPRADYMVCGHCSKPCPEKKDCQGRFPEGGQCGICHPRFTCGFCFGKYAEDSKTVEIPASDTNSYDHLSLRWRRQFGSATPAADTLKVCGECASVYYCKKCKKYDFTSPVEQASGECALCVDSKIEAERLKHEAFPDGWIPRHGSLVIPSVAFRPFRTISYELEVDGDGPLIARTLYRCGLVPLSRVAGYNQHADVSEAEYPCFMKHDGSVTGGEIIAYLLNLDDEKHAAALLDTCRKVYSLIQLKKASIGPRSGGHLHVDAHNFSYGDVWRLLTIFNYLEDPLYRIAGAGTEGGHRSLDPKNKEHNGEGYTTSPVKGPFGTKGALGRSIQAQRRNSGLNFTPFISSAGNCECGSMAYEDSKNCKCNLGKATIEWRVFNATVNPRILHAWIALVQAMMAWSEGDTDPTPEWEKQYEALPWAQRRFDSLAAAKKDLVRTRIEWIFRNLPLTEDERDSLAYAVEQSDIDMDVAALRAIVPLNEFPHKKPPRNPARRKRALKLEPPTPGTPEPRVPEYRDPSHSVSPFRVRRSNRPTVEQVRAALRFDDQPDVSQAPVSPAPPTPQPLSSRPGVTLTFVDDDGL